MLTFLCVLKKYNKKNNIPSRFFYDENDVIFLKKSISKYYSKEFKFYCLTDVENIDDVDIIKLTDGYDRYWSKIELFKHDFGKSVYFDLDCIILKNIDWLDNIEVSENNFWTSSHLLAGEHSMNSSLMLWKGSKKFISENFNYENIINNNYYEYGGSNPKTHVLLEPGKTYNVGDQGLINEKLQENKIKINYFDLNKVNFYSHCNIQNRKKLDVLFFPGLPKLKHCSFSEQHETYIADLEKIKKINVNDFLSIASNIFLFDFHNEELIKYVYYKFQKNSNEKEFLIYKINYYNKLLRKFTKITDALIEHKQDYLNVIEDCKKKFIKLL